MDAGYFKIDSRTTVDGNEERSISRLDYKNQLIWATGDAWGERRYGGRGSDGGEWEGKMNGERLEETR